ncbi:MAG: hypothetical protein CMD99_10375 [Gammaproteobacteria bacterium]|nr:hypothetical protein [Gammaproteobacteria bacterium]
MNWLAELDEALEQRNSQKRRLLMIFKGNGDWCPWCNKLEALLNNDDALDDYLELEGILGAKIGIPRKSEDITGIRERFGITGIPFLLFYSDDGRIEGTTEFIDGGNAVSYVSWIESVDSSAL